MIAWQSNNVFADEPPRTDMNIYEFKIDRLTQHKYGKICIALEQLALSPYIASSLDI